KERARDAGEPGSGEPGSGESGATSAPGKEEARSGGRGALDGQESLRAGVGSELAGGGRGVGWARRGRLGRGGPGVVQPGPLAQTERWLPGLGTMEKVAAWAITEPDSGSDASGGMQTYVRKDGDEYILNGRKTFITNGPAADILIVYAKLDEGDPTVDRR